MIQCPLAANQMRYFIHFSIGIQTLRPSVVYEIYMLIESLTPPLVCRRRLNCVQLLESFKKAGRHNRPSSPDEFGSIQGMVTLIDVLEAIVGDLPAQGQRDQPRRKKREDGSWLIDATMAINELKIILHLDELPQEAEADYQTLGGLVMTQFGRIPVAGDRSNGWLAF